MSNDPSQTAVAQRCFLYGMEGCGGLQMARAEKKGTVVLRDHGA